MIIPRFGENKSEIITSVLMQMTIIGPVGHFGIELLINTPDMPAQQLTKIEMKIILLNEFVHCLAATPGAIIKALIKITPMLCKPITIVITSKTVNVVSITDMGLPNVL